MAYVLSYFHRKLLFVAYVTKKMKQKRRKRSSIITGHAAQSAISGYIQAALFAEKVKIFVIHVHKQNINYFTCNFIFVKYTMSMAGVFVPISLLTKYKTTNYLYYL